MVIRIKKSQLNNIFITGDHHFGHENIIKFCDRPFKTVGEMDATLIENWNSQVKLDDTVIHLGDFTLGDWACAESYFTQLNGKIKMMANDWHHDKRWLPKDYYGPVQLEYPETRVNVEIIPPMIVLEIPEMGNGGHPLAITLCHYPLAVWDRKHYGAWHLHGHSHGNYTYIAEDDDVDVTLDIGVDCMDYYPVSLEKISELIYEIF